MERIGWTLFFAGSAILLWAGFFGTDLGGVKISNVPSLAVGMSLMVCGSIIGAVGSAMEVLRNNHEDFKMILGIPDHMIPEITSLDKSGLPVTSSGENTGCEWLFMKEKFKSKEDAIKARESYISKYRRKQS